MSNNSPIYNWTYGYYIDNITDKKISVNDIIRHKTLSSNQISFNNKIDLISKPSSSSSLAKDYNGIFYDNELLNQNRQYISVSFFDNPINILELEFNFDIFENLIISNNTDLTTVSKDKAPYILLLSTNNNIVIDIDKCIYDSNNKIIKFIPSETIYGIKEIRFYGTKPDIIYSINSVIEPIGENGWKSYSVENNTFRLTDPQTNNRHNIIFSENISTNFQTYTRNRHSNKLNINNNSLINIDKESYLYSTYSTQTYGSLFGYLEFVSKDSIDTSNLFLKNSTFNSTPYFYLSEENLVPTKDPVLVNGGLYISKTENKQLKQRVSHFFAKNWDAYKSVLDDNWVNDLIVLLKNTSRDLTVSSYFNLDDLEFLDVYKSGAVKLTHLLITIDKDLPTPTPTLTPSNTATPEVSPTPTITPSPSLEVGKSGFVYAWGSNKYRDDIIVNPTKIEQDNTFVGIDLLFTNIFTGTNHHIASRSDRILFPIKDNRVSQLGLPFSDNIRSLNKLSTIISTTDSRWKVVGIGDDFTFILNLNNEIYRWGSNKNNQLDSMFEVLPLPSQLIIDDNTQFSDLACGMSHSIVIDNSGQPYICGNINGQIISKFTKFSENIQWEKIFTNETHTFGIKRNDSGLYVLRGRVGSENITLNSTPKIIDLNISGYRSIDVGDEHILVVKQDGSLWVFGSNNYGQLGTGDQEPIFDKLTTKDVYRNWKKAAAGSRHSLAINSIGVLYGWGSGEDYQFGFVQKDFYEPTPIWGGNWIDISAKGNMNGAIAGNYIIQELTTQTPTPTKSNTPTPTVTPTISDSPRPSPPPPSNSNTASVTPTLTSTQTRTPTQTPTPTITQPIYLFKIVDILPVSATPTPTKTQQPIPPSPTPTKKIYDFTTINFIV